MLTWAERIAASAAEEAYWDSLSSGKSKGKGKGKGSAKGYQGEGRGGKGSAGGRGKSAGSKGSGGEGTDKGPSSGAPNRWWQCPVKKCVAHCGGKPCWNRPMATHCKCCMQQRDTAAVTDRADEEQKLKALRKDVAADAAAKPSSDEAMVTADKLEDMCNSVRLECLYDLAHGNPTGLSKGAQRKLKKEATPEELKKAGFTATQAASPAAVGLPDGSLAGGAAAADAAEAAIDVDDEGWETSAEARANLKRLGLQPVEYVDPATMYAQPPPPATGTIEQAVAKALAGEVSVAISAQQQTVYNLSAAADAARVFGVKDELFIMAKKRLDAATSALKLLTDKAPAVGSQSVVEKLKKARQSWIVYVTDANEGRAKGKEKAGAKHQADLDTIDQQIERLKSLRQTVVTTFANTEAAFRKAQEARERWNKDIASRIDDRIMLVTPIGGEGVDGPGEEELGESENAAPATVNYSELMLTASDISQEDVPAVDIEAATAEQKAVLEAIWAYFEALRAAPMGMPTPPTTFQQMGAGHVHIAQTLVGVKIWRAVYGATRVVQPTDFVPWQMLNLLRHAMTKAKTKISVSKELADNASLAYLDAKSCAKDNGYCPF